MCMPVTRPPLGAEPPVGRVTAVTVLPWAEKLLPAPSKFAAAVSELSLIPVLLKAWLSAAAIETGTTALWLTGAESSVNVAAAVILPVPAELSDAAR